MDRRTVLKYGAALAALQGSGGAVRAQPGLLAPADHALRIEPNPGYQRIACEEAWTTNQEVMGVEHVLYAMDYPYQMDDYEVAATDTMPIPYEDTVKLFQTNAERLFNLAPPRDGRGRIRS